MIGKFFSRAILLANCVCSVYSAASPEVVSTAVDNICIDWVNYKITGDSTASATAPSLRWGEFGRNVVCYKGTAFEITAVTPASPEVYPPLAMILIARNVQAIEKNSFDKDTGIGQIIFEASSKVRFIRTRAFAGSSLQSICIPARVKVLERSVFCDCYSHVTFANGSALKTIARLAFYCAALMEIQIPPRVKYIEQEAFSSCCNLSRVIFCGNNVQGLGPHAFHDCRELRSISFPSSITKIEGGAFKHCFGLSFIEILPHVTDIGFEAFEDCTSLENVTISDGLPKIPENIARKVRTRWGRIFINCSALRHIILTKSKYRVIKDEVTYLNRLIKNPPQGCKATFERSGQTYGYRGQEWQKTKVVAAAGHAGVPPVNICIDCVNYKITGGSAASAMAPFLRCWELGRSVVYYKGISFEITKVANANPEKHSPLARILITRNVLEIEKNSFKKNKAFCPIVFEAGCKIRSIGARAFAGSRLQAICIPAEVEVIWQCAFLACHSLSNVVFASGSVLKTIAKRAFYFCISLIKIQIPSYVECIEQEAFSYCGNLSNVIFEGNNVQELGQGAFSKCGTLCNIDIPSSVIKIGLDAFVDCFALSYIELPSRAVNVPFNVLNNCPALEEVTISDGLPKIYTEPSYSPQGAKILGITLKNCNAVHHIFITESERRVIKKDVTYLKRLIKDPTPGCEATFERSGKTYVYDDQIWQEVGP